MHAYYFQKKLCMHHKLKMGNRTIYEIIVQKFNYYDLNTEYKNQNGQKSLHKF